MYTSIQKATTADATLIANIGAKTFIESHGHSASTTDIESYVSKKYTLNAIEEELNDPGNIFHIIYYEGRAAGYSKMIFNCSHSLIKGNNVTKLERLYLLKDFYDLKLGIILFEFITALSKSAGQRGMWLFVWIENQRAVGFYKRSGFEIIGRADFRISETHSNLNHIMYLKYV